MDNKTPPLWRIIELINKKTTPLGCVALLNIQNVSFSYKYFSIFAGSIVTFFLYSDVMPHCK